MIKIGVCCFDDVNDPEGGWASVAGDECYRVSGLSDLGSNLLWVTNLPYTSYKRLNLITSPHLFDTQFFRTSLDQIAKENGLEGEDQDLAEFCSMLFTKIANSGNDHFGVDLRSPGYRYHKLLSYSLIPDFARRRPDGRFSGDIFDAIQNSTQSNQAMTGVTQPGGSRAVSFLFPRGPYAKWILSQRYPSGSKWTEIKQKNDSAVFGFEDGRVIRSTASVVERLEELGKTNAVFLRVVVHSMDPLYQRFASFGASGSYGPSARQKHRRWATLPEVLEMSKYAKVEVKGGYMTPFHEGSLVEPAVLQTTGMSYATGLFLENAWVAMCSPISTQTGPTETMLGAYMRAYDRLACGRAAANFAKAGFVVGSYSVGRLIVFIRPGEEYQAAKHAFESGLLPPMSFMNKGQG